MIRVCFHASEKPRERILADAFLRGCIEHGDEGSVKLLKGDTTKKLAECEVAVMVGVKSRELFQAYWRAGTHIVYLDKGYARHQASGPVAGWEYWRASVDAHHPTKYLMSVPRPDDRLERLGLKMKPWKTGRTIVIAGSSAKYHAFYGLPEPTAYAARLVQNLKRLGREVVYRPKPSWREAVEIRGSRFSMGEPLADVLAEAHVMVTHGSNAVWESILAGVPCIVLGDAVAKPISSIDIEDVESPYMAPDEDRRQWLANLAYCQWTLAEMSSGEAWNVIRPQIFG